MILFVLLLFKKINKIQIDILKSKIVLINSIIIAENYFNNPFLQIKISKKKCDLIRKFQVLSFVSSIVYTDKKFILSNKDIFPINYKIKIGHHTVGGNKISIFAGPCSVESEKQLLLISNQIFNRGVDFLRGGIFKPRTSPYSFQGLQIKGLKILKKIKQQFSFGIITEIMSENDIDYLSKCCDIFQVGTRNAQNYSLLKALGKQKKTVFLKRGFGCTLIEFLLSAEYILSGGNSNVILCERGIRTFETATRFTLDINGIVWLKNYCKLPVIADVSHSTGNFLMIENVAKGAIAAGADGIMVEVHNNPKISKSDGIQSLTIKKFSSLMEAIRPVAISVNRKI